MSYREAFLPVENGPMGTQMSNRKSEHLMLEEVKNQHIGCCFRVFHKRAVLLSSLKKEQFGVLTACSPSELALLSLFKQNNAITYGLLD